MTEFEMISTLQGYNNIGIAIVMNFFTVLTAYLAAGYLSAHTLTRGMAAFVTAMFVVLSMVFVLAASNNATATNHLLVEMVKFAKAGKGLAWGNWASMSVENFTIGAVVVTTVLLAIMIGGVIAGVYFFYDCRKRSLQASS